MILLVVDTQKGCFDERLYAFETVRKNIKTLIAEAREKMLRSYTSSTMTAPEPTWTDPRITMRYTRILHREMARSDSRRM